MIALENKYLLLEGSTMGCSAIEQFLNYCHFEARTFHAGLDLASGTNMRGVSQQDWYIFSGKKTVLQRLKEEGEFLKNQWRFNDVKVHSK